MTIHRVKHPSIPSSALKPGTNLRPKSLRWFKDEQHFHPNDCMLSVDNETNHDYVLWAVFRPVPLNPADTKGGYLVSGKQSFDQCIVDQIEIAPNSLAQECDFVIFENSPMRRKELEGKSV